MATTQIDNLVPELLAMKEVEIPATLTDPLLREVYKNEVLVLQRIARKMQEMGSTAFSGDVLSGIYMGMETFARRLQEIQKEGLQKVYAENKQKL